MLMRVPPDKMPERSPPWWRDADGFFVVLFISIFVVTILIIVYALFIG